jgi:4-oxalocrotonate tautomerase family enzyme
MPQVKIEIEKGNSQKFLSTLINVTMDCVQQTLNLPATDRNIRLMEYDNGLFFSKPPYRIFIEISMFTGRTKETKKRLFQKIVTELNEKLSLDKEEIFILINEQPKENWGIRGGIPANEIDLGFKVEI